MTFFTRYRFFQKAASAILILFMAIMVVVIIKAYSRASGNTGLDMAKIKEIRLKALKTKEISQK